MNQPQPHIEYETPRTPPHDDDAERAVLGSIMLDERCYVGVAKLLDYKDFYRPPHRYIFRAMGELQEGGSGIDVLTIAGLLERQGHLEATGGRQYLTRLSNKVPSAANVGSYAEIIAEHSRIRRLIKGLDAVVSYCYGGATSQDATDRASTIIRQVAEQSKRESSDPKEVAKKIVQYHTDVLSGEVVREYDTGFKGLDMLTRWGVGKYTVVGAYSGHGKTTICGTAIAGLADKHDAVVSWWNCEIAQIFQAMRIFTPLFATDGGGQPAVLEHWAMNPDRVPEKHRTRFESRFIEAVSWFKDSGIHIEPPGAINIREVELTAQSLKLRYPDRPLVVVCDYLQRMTTEQGSRQSKGERISEASRRLSDLAKQLDCIVIAASQFTDGEYTKQQTIPMPAVGQTRDTKDVRNDADKFLAYHRPWANASQHNDLAILEVGKDRWGVNSHVVLRSDGGANTFESYDDALPKGVPGLHSRRLNSGWGRA